jgi:hypothetical protein
VHETSVLSEEGTAHEDRNDSAKQIALPIGAQIDFQMSIFAAITSTRRHVCAACEEGADTTATFSFPIHHSLWHRV